MPLGRYAALLVLVLAVALAAGCERRAGRAASMEAVRAEAGPAQETWQTRLDVLEDGRPRVEMHADYMARFEQGDSTFLLMQPRDSLAGRVRIRLFDTGGDSSATLTARRVHYFQDEGRLEARGDVVVHTREGKRLYSEHLDWDEDARQVETPGFVRIVSPDETIRGYGLTADEDLASYTLSDVTGHVFRDE